MAKRKITTVSLSAETVDLISQLKVLENRSMSNLIEHIVRVYYNVITQAQGQG